MEQPSEAESSSDVTVAAETLAEVTITPSTRNGREYAAFNDALETVRAAYLSAAGDDGDLSIVLIRVAAA